jgi:hypothetical protein
MTVLTVTICKLHQTASMESYLRSSHFNASKPVDLNQELATNNASPLPRLIQFFAHQSLKLRYLSCKQTTRIAEEIRGLKLLELRRTSC